MMPAIYPVTCHTDHVGPGSTFVVIQGFAHNGCAYIVTALEKGAITIVVDQELSPVVCTQIEDRGATLVRVQDARTALAELSAQASHYAHKKLKLIGITGTKGKTTTAHLLFHMLKTVGLKTGLLSTVGNAIGDCRFAPSLTTPQPDYLHQFFKMAVEQQCEWIVMEVAAQAVSMRRIEGLQFDAIVMTNFDREHLEFYDSMESYFADKVALLQYRKAGAPAWINQDNAWLSSINASDITWFSCNSSAELSGRMCNSQNFTLAADIAYREHTIKIVCPTLTGDYNLSNIVAACGGASTVGLSLQECAHALTSFAGIAGRQERIQLPNNALAIIDYAHNPQSYRAFFNAVRSYTDHLIVIFGAGGNRDQGKRPEMGAVVAQYADQIIITTDNPRYEDPDHIVADIMQGIPYPLHNFVIYEPDRKKAIEKAYGLSRPSSVIALLGKGPDEYQLIRDAKIPFSEREILLSQK